MTLQRTRDYELVMILSPEATESEAAATARRISTLIADGGGSVSHQENWGSRRLAYPIQRFIEGNYFIIRCVMNPQAATELDKTLNAAQDVLRHLIFRLEKSEIAAMEAQTERARQARERDDARAAAERQARERDDARQAAAQSVPPPAQPPTQASAPTPPTPAPAPTPPAAAPTAPSAAAPSPASPPA